MNWLNLSFGVLFDAICEAASGRPLELPNHWKPLRNSMFRVMCFHALLHLLQHALRTNGLAGRVHGESHCNYPRLQLYLPSLGKVTMLTRYLQLSEFPIIHFEPTTNLTFPNAPYKSWVHGNRCGTVCLWSWRWYSLFTEQQWKRLQKPMVATNAKALGWRQFKLILLLSLFSSRDITTAKDEHRGSGTDDS